jgi:hypothetical protein
MAITPEQFAQIRREISEETERRMLRAGYARCPMDQKEFVRSEPRAAEPVQAAAPRPREATTMSAEASADWNKWIDPMIGRWIETNFVPALGDVLRKKSEEVIALADEIGTFTGETTRRLQAIEAELADVRTAIAEVRNRLAAAEGRLAPLTADEEHKSSPLALPPPGWIGRA